MNYVVNSHTPSDTTPHDGQARRTNLKQTKRGLPRLAAVLAPRRYRPPVPRRRCGRFLNDVSASTTEPARDTRVWFLRLP